MIRVPGWIFGAALILAAAACGASEKPDEPAQQETSTATQPQAPSLEVEEQPSEAAEPVVEETATEGMAEAGAAVPMTDRLYTVQVASFLNAESARAWAGRLSKNYPVWTTSATVNGRTFHRLRIGASPSMAEARSLGERIRREFNWPVWIAPVDDNAQVPADAIAQTNRLVR